MQYFLFDKKPEESSGFSITNRIVLIMKMTFFLLLVLVTCVKAESMAQKVTLSFKNAKIEQVFSEITKQTGYRFLYSDEVSKRASSVDILVRNVDLDDALDRLTEGKEMRYKLIANTVTIDVVPGSSNLPAQSVIVTQQDVSVSGVIVDRDGNPLQGASVSLKGRRELGTSTDAQGRFSLTIPNLNSSLIVSYIGFIEQEVSLEGRNSVNVVLQEEDSELDEVVVVGYGTQRRHEITGSVTSVTPDDFNAGVVSSPSQLLVGKVAGLVVNRPGGDPTAGSTIQLRGPSSLTASSEPFYVIDGVPGASIDLVAPDDIASIDVLKDASSAAIYGSRAANGVILITTKKGKTGKPVLSYSGYTALESISRGVDVLNPVEYRKFVADNNLVVNGINDGYSTDWQDEIYRKAVSQSHSLSLRGGSESSTYNASLTYFNNPGIVKSNSYERMVGRLALTQDLFNDRVKFGLTLSNSINNSNHIDYGIFANSATSLPISPITHSDSRFDMYDGYYQLIGQGVRNPVALLNQRHEDRQRNIFLGNTNLDITILPELTLNLSGTIQREDYDRNYYREIGDVDETTNGLGYAERLSVKNTDNTFESVLNYSKTFNGLHEFKALAGYSYQQVIINDGISGRQNTFSSDAIGSGNLSFGQGDATLHFREFPEKSKSQLVSYFGRINYSFDRKYILSGTLRRDGSSKFGVNNRWALFPSAGAAWRISEEDFMKNQDWISNLNFRTGFGISGNQNIPPYRSMTLYGPQDSQFLYNGKWTNSYSVIQNPNPDLKWESTQMFNLGLDFEILQGLLSGTIEYYSKETKDLLYTYDVPTPPYQYNRLLANGATMTNKGIEVSLNARLMNREDFQWNSTANFASNRNRIGSLSSNIDNLSVTDRLEGAVGLGGWTGQYISIVKPGYAVGTFNTVKYLGFDSSLQQTIYENGDGEVVTSDKLITPNDYQILGNALPKFTFGWSNSFRYKQFDLNVFLRGVYGNKIFNATRANLSRLDQIGSYNVLKIAAEEGIFESPVASSRWLEDGSFLRLDNATLGYTFDVAGLKGFNSARIYFTVQNLFTITEYTGVDPEVSLGGLAPGIDNQNYYPKTRSYTLGVNLSF